MAIWRLRERLAIVVLGLPLALGACKKKQRDTPPPTPDAAVIAQPPAAEIDAALEPPADAATATLQEQIEAVKKGGGKVDIGLRNENVRGRPAYERGIARVARIRAGATWSGGRV